MVFACLLVCLFEGLSCFDLIFFFSAGFLFVCLFSLLIIKGLFSGCARRGKGKPLGRDLTCFGGLCCSPLLLG